MYFIHLRENIQSLIRTKYTSSREDLCSTDYEIETKDGHLLESKISEELNMTELAPLTDLDMFFQWDLSRVLFLSL